MTSQQPPAKYANLIGEIIEKVKQNLKASDSLLPVAFLINLEQNKIEVVASTFDDERMKDYFAETVRQRANRLEADAVCFASEAWSLPEKYSNQEEMDRIYKVYGSIADFPERIEIVALSLQTHEGFWMAHSGIAPAKKGRKATGFKWMKADSAGGRFASFLPPKYPTPEQVSNFMQLARYKMIAAGLQPDAVLGTRTLYDMLEQHVRQAPVQRLTEAVLDKLISDFANMMRRGEGDSNGPR